MGKTLLGLSAVGLVIARSGLVPSRISALGIEFDRADQSALLAMLAAVLLYFLVAFVVYAMSDLVAWRIAYRNAVLLSRREHEAQTDEQRTVEDRVRQSLPSGQWLVGASRPVSVTRAVFEFGVPLVIGVFAVYSLLASQPAGAGNPAESNKGTSSSVVQPAAVEGNDTNAQPNKRLEPSAPRP